MSRSEWKDPPRASRWPAPGWETTPGEAAEPGVAWTCRTEREQAEGGGARRGWHSGARCQDRPGVSFRDGSAGFVGQSLVACDGSPHAPPPLDKQVSSEAALLPKTATILNSGASRGEKSTGGRNCACSVRVSGRGLPSKAVPAPGRGAPGGQLSPDGPSPANLGDASGKREVLAASFPGGPTGGPRAVK